MQLTDTHAHLDDNAFANDLPGVLERAEMAGVTHIVTVGSDLVSSRAAVRLAEARQSVWAAVGVHPHDARKVYPSDVEALRDLACHPRVVAIGETGLDFYRDLSPRQAQLAVFRLHLDLARELDLPVIVHDREAHAETFRELQNWAQGQERENLGVLHCFSGELAMAQEAVALGFYISFAGPVTYQKSERLAEIVRSLPPERLLIETDCPYLPPEPYRGCRNEPAHVVRVAQAIAQIRGMKLEAVATLTTANALRLFWTGD